MRKILTLALAITAFAAITATATANHSWGNYHWARTTNPFTVKVIDANSTAWDARLDKAILDWNSSSVLNVIKENGTADKRCRPVAGKVKSCDGSYGRNGWLGLAQIWVSGGHITQGTAKMNDTYLASSSYSETNRQHVMCQEIGHDWGLGHQDESGADLNTCMDYSNTLDNPSPNAHDFDQLVTIYGSHTDSTTTIATGLAGKGSGKPASVERDDRISSSVITENYSDGSKKVTHVFWALETRGKSAEHAFGGGDDD